MPVDEVGSGFCVAEVRSVSVCTWVVDILPAVVACDSGASYESSDEGSDESVIATVGAVRY